MGAQAEAVITHSIAHFRLAAIMPNATYDNMQGWNLKSGVDMLQVQTWNLNSGGPKFAKWQRWAPMGPSAKPVVTQNIASAKLV